jgi:cysteine-rich repeat protein
LTVEDIFATTGTTKKLILVGSPEYCGDKIVQNHLGEECDDGNAINTDYCTGKFCILTTILNCLKQRIAKNQNVVMDGHKRGNNAMMETSYPVCT